MAVFKQQKDPRYKPIPGKLKRWQDVVTGEVLTRTQWEKATARSRSTNNTAGSAFSHGKTGAARVQNTENASHTATRRTTQEHVQAPEDTTQGPVPIVEAPEPPPMVAAAYDVTREAAEVAHAASAGMDRLATKIGQGIAQCASYAAEAFLPAHRSYLVPPEAALRQVTEPGARLFARHSHIQVDLGPDGDDIGDLFVGVMACITAISVQKIQYENARLQAIHDFEVANGPGSYAAAVAAMRGQAPQGASQNGQAQNGHGHQNGSGGSANGTPAYPGPNQQGDGRITTLTDQLLREHANGHRERRHLG